MFFTLQTYTFFPITYNKKARRNAGLFTYFQM